MRALCSTLTILLLALLTHQSLAQRPDVRVSPPDLTTKALPPDIQIQSAEQIGTHTLVVWGTTRANGDSVVPALRMQMLDGSAFSGEQVQLTSDEARPGRLVQVIPFDTSFAIIWNDYRNDGPGLYLRFVNSNGAPYGSEQRISTGYPVPDSTGHIIVLGERKGRLLLWQDKRASAPGLYGIRIIEGIGAISTEQQLGKSIANLLTYHNLPGWILMNIPPMGWIAVDNSGQIDSRSLPQSLFNSAYYLNTDTSLVRMSGDSLLFFASIFDTHPAKVLVIDALDSATKNTTQIGRDSAGILVVYFSTITATGTADTSGQIRENVYQISITNEGMVSAPKQVYSYYNPSNGGCIHWITCYVSSYLGSFVVPGCNNTSLLKHRWRYTHYYHSVVDLDKENEENFSVDSFGNFTPNGRGYSQFSAIIIPSIIHRSVDSTASIVQIDLADTSVDIIAEAASRQLVFTQTLPVLYRTNGLLMTTWQQVSEKTSFDLSEWNASNDLPATLRDRAFALEMPKPGYPQQVKLVNGYFYDNSDAVLNISDLSLISSQKRVQASGIYQISPLSSLDGVFDWNHYVLRRAQAEKWETLIDLNDAPSFVVFSPEQGVWRRGLPQGYDPNSGTLLLTVVTLNSYYGYDVNRTVYAFGSDGKQQWSVDLPDRVWLTTMIVPGDSLQFIRFDGLEATTLQMRDTIRKFSFTQSGVNPRYQRLKGRYFLRRYWTDSTGTDLRLELYTLDGTLRHANTVHHHSRNDDMLIFQRPTDSAIAIISGSEHGVQFTVLNSRLEVLAENVTISETHDIVVHPSATFRNDTLFFIWQDNRNGNADIYGNAVAWNNAVPSTSGASIPPVTSIYSPVISPNPASNAAIIELDAEQGTHVVAEIFTMLGEVVARKEINAVETGRSYLQLDLRGLPDGAYMVRYRNGDAIGTLPLRIIQ